MINKKLIALLLAVLMSLSALDVTPAAEENKSWIFIDGENITRTVNTAVVYRGVATTGQTQWGHDIVVDENGVVTKIIEGGLSEGENLPVPEKGMVISAAGVKVQWFKDNVAVGDKLFYDSHTQRLFICDAAGGFDPYFEKTLTVNGEGNYIISNPTVQGTPYYTFEIGVDSNGRVVSRGSNIVLPEGGYLISAATYDDMQTLIAHAPIGASCTVKDGIATLTYNKTMLKRSVEIALMNAELLIYNSKMNYEDVDYTALDASAEEISAAITAITSYSETVNLMHRIEKEITRLCFDFDSAELRGAFHTPKEKDINAVRQTVLSAKANGLNTLILKATNGYGTFIPLPESDKFSQDEYFGGFDVLKAYIDVCDEENIALVLAIDVYYNEYASIAAPQWTSTTNTGENSISKKYYSPSNSEFADYFVNYVKYIASEYEIKNIMLDHIRYPRFNEKSDYGYDNQTLQAFAESNDISLAEAEELKKKLFDSPHWQAWVAYRSGLVTNMVERVSETIKETRSDINITAVSARDTVDYFYMQDSVGWIENGLVDGLCLALFEGDVDENDPLDELAYADSIVTAKGEIIGAYTHKEKNFFVGLDASQSAKNLTQAIEQSRNINANGIIFSDLNTYIAQNHYGIMQNGILKGDSVSPLQNTIFCIRQLLEYSKTKLDNSILPFGGCDEESVAAALAKINEAILALEKGVLSHEYANALENDIAMIFASSSAKQEILKEFEAITKLALLHKTASATLPPVIDDPITDPETSQGEESEVSEPDESEKPINGNENSDYNPDYIQSGESGISIGNVLIYLFVGITLVSAVAAVVVGIHRKSQRPAGSHMPKAMKRELMEKDKDKEEEE